MARYWLVAVIIGTILTLAGAKEFWLAFQNRTQIEMSLAEYLRTRPEGRWVKLTDCRVAYPGMVYVETLRRGSITLSDVSVPVLPDYNLRQPVAVVLCVADKRERAVVRSYRTMGMPTETVEGIIRGSRMSKKLQELAPWKPAESHVIIDEGRKPSVRNAAAMLGIGTVLLGWMGVIVVRRFNLAGL
jgi:hypothetical protein